MITFRMFQKKKKKGLQFEILKFLDELYVLDKVFLNDFLENSLSIHTIVIFRQRFVNSSWPLKMSKTTLITFGSIVILCFKIFETITHKNTYWVARSKTRNL